MLTMKDYICRRKATIVGYISNLPTNELFTGLESIPGYSRFLRWWDQYLTQEEGVDGASERQERKVG